jgi:hypothetical protein
LASDRGRKRRSLLEPSGTFKGLSFNTGKHPARMQGPMAIIRTGR